MMTREGVVTFGILTATSLLIPFALDPFSAPKLFALQSGGLALLVFGYVRQYPLSTRARGAAALVGLVALYSLMLARDRQEVVLEAAGLLSLVGFGIFFARSAQPGRWARAFLAVGILQVLTGLAQWALLPEPFRLGDFPDRMKFIGTFGNPQYIASFCGILFLLLWNPPAEIRWRKWERWTGLMLLGGGLLWCRAQATLFSLLLVLGMRQRRIGGLWVVAGALGVTAATSQLHWHTFTGRWLLWRSGWQVFLDSQGWGVGLGQFGHHYLAAQRTVLALPFWRGLAGNAAAVTHPHNEYVALLAELGIPGLLLLALGLFHWRRAENRGLGDPAYRGILVFCALDALFSFPWRILPIQLLLVFVLARAVRWPAGERSPLAGAVALPLIGVFSFLLWLQAGEQGWGGWALHQLGKGNLSASETAVERALGFHPQQETLLLLKARLRFLDFDPVGALTWAQKLERVGETVDSMKVAGLSLLDQRRWEEAEALYQKLAATLPWQVTAHYYLGKIYEKTGRPEAATREYALTWQARPTNRKAVLDRWRAVGRF